MSKTVTFADLPKETLLGICDYLRGDGHGLYDPKFLAELSVPDDLIASVTHTYESDGTYKGTMFDGDGNVISKQTAVYSLSLYQRINNDLGLASSQSMGRGFRASEYDAHIREWAAS